jgi:hypothetical protein
MLRVFWSAIKAVKPDVEGEQRRPGTWEGDIAERLERAGLRDLTGGTIDVQVEYAGFEDLWVPFTYGVGPAGQAFAELDDERKAAVRDAIRADLPDGPFDLDARAWYAVGTA